MTAALDATDGPRPPDRMTAAQAARRRRVLQAVIALVREGDVEQLSMKDIADRAGVALGTIYRYFSSKEHVLAAALDEWARGLDQGGARPAAGRDPAERLVSVLRRALRAYEREPAFARLMIRVTSSDDPHANESLRSLTATVFGALDRAVGEGIDPADRDVAMHIIGCVWHQSLDAWVRGRCSIADVRSSLEATARLLVRGDASRAATA